jgi:hypothetical protein
VCVCVCVSIYLRRHDRHRESEIGCDSPGCGVTNVITSLLEIPVRENRSAPIPWGYSRPNLIRSHAPRLPGRRPSSAVHLFCVSSRGRLLHNSEGRLRRHRCRKTLDLKNVASKFSGPMTLRIIILCLSLWKNFSSRNPRGLCDSTMMPSSPTADSRVSELWLGRRI